MAGHNESEKKSSDAVNDLQTFRAENLQSNMKVIYYSRTFLSIIGGVIAGILGFTGLTGFVFYFLVMAITSVALIAKAKFSIHTYFDSWNRVVFDGFLGGLMSFVLFWTYPLHYLRYLSVNILENYNCNIGWLALVDDIGLGRTRVLLGTDTRKHMVSKNQA
ncbi:ER membrane protein complex subunit 6 isoform X1 [Populus alba x Populus x berolinensis]|nr:ER membrane protein complex subunit 6 isoform X1 [Populus alba x Populus x berolinensis]